jgi:hypothetical protein
MKRKAKYSVVAYVHRNKQNPGWGEGKGEGEAKQKTLTLTLILTHPHPLFILNNVFYFCIDRNIRM